MSENPIDAKMAEVTCRVCGRTYSPSPMDDFYQDDGATTGRCDGCFMRDVFSAQAKSQPATLPSEQHITSVCKRGQGSETCRYLSFGGQGFVCAKGTDIGTIIDRRSAEGTMKSKGNNCSGPPNFTPN